MTDKKLRKKLKDQEERIKNAAQSAARAEILQQEEAGFLEAEGLEKTFAYRQDQLAKDVDINTASKVRTASHIRLLLSDTFSLDLQPRFT